MSHLNKLLCALPSSEAEAVLITSEINQRYISGFPFSDGYLLIMPQASYLITDSRYTEAARAQAAEGLEVVAPGKMMAFVAEKLAENGLRSCGFEEATLSYATLERLRRALPGIELVPCASQLLDGLREIKDAEELENTARAQDIADAAFEHILKFMTPEMTELEVALELEFFMRRNGAEAVAFETIAVSGSASSMPHGVPRPVKLERGFLTMDYGARVRGYCSDMTRTVVLGRADADMKKLYNTVLSAQLAGLEAVREGADCRAVDRASRDIIYGAGYEGCFGHGLGHGVGMYIHESPRLSPGAPEGSRLVAGQIVTVEPGIYLEGRYGCRIEDMVAVTADGCRNFAHSPKELIEVF